MVSMRKLIPLFLVLVTAGALSAEFDTDTLPEDLAPRVKEFLDADTAKARGSMPAFSNEDLQKIQNAFKKDHSSGDQRLFWLVEESYRRNAELVAAERIRYLYYAVLAALAIIAAFTALTYARARKVTLPASHVSLPPVSSPAPSVEPKASLRVKSKSGKKKR